MRERHHRTFVPAQLRGSVEPGDYTFTYTYSDGRRSASSTGRTRVDPYGHHFDSSTEVRRVRLVVEGTGAIVGTGGDADNYEWFPLGVGMQRLPYVREYMVKRGQGFHVSFVETEDASMIVTLDGVPCPVTAAGLRDFENLFGEAIQYETPRCYWNP